MVSSWRKKDKREEGGRSLIILKSYCGKILLVLLPLIPLLIRGAG